MVYFFQIAGNKAVASYFYSDVKTSQMKKICLSLFSFILGLIAFTQDKGIKIEIKKETNWYASPYVWVIGAAVFILILVALLRGRKT
jgi:hypothetical protein